MPQRSLHFEWSCFDLDAVRDKVADSFVDRPRPFEADVAVTRANRFKRDIPRVGSRTVDTQVLVAEAVDESAAPLDYLGTKYVSVEGIRALPIGDGNHAVVDDDRSRHRVGSYLSPPRHP